MSQLSATAAVDQSPSGSILSRFRDSTLANIRTLKKRTDLGQVLLFAVPIVFFVIQALRQRWMSDDGFINIRVIDQLLAGHGPVFNQGERVEVGTSTLFLYLVALGRLLIPIETSLIAVGLGIFLSTAAIGFLAAGGLQVARVLGFGGYRIPLGVGVVAAIPPMWDFATSGLETSLTFLWIALCVWGLARRLSSVQDQDLRQAVWRPVWLVIVIGLAPLVRPDLTLMAIVFAIMLLIQSTVSFRGLLACIALAAVIPLAYQIFRMGYYGILVPNTAVAKGAGDSLWTVGLAYLDNYVTPYWLAIPFVAALLIVGWRSYLVTKTTANWRHRAAIIALVVGPLVAGVLHAVYVVRIGGDFMHGRFLLPATVAIFSAIAVVSLREWDRDKTARIVGAVLIVVTKLWVIIPAALAKTDGDTAYEMFTNERVYYLRANPQNELVRLGDWRSGPPYMDGLGMRSHAVNQEVGFYEFEGGTFPPRRPGEVSAAFAAIGVASVAAGNSVTVVDLMGLADPVASHMQVPKPLMPRPGHAVRPGYCAQAKYALPQPTDSAQVRAAREALACGDLARLQLMYEGALTPSRFARNLRDSFRMTSFAFPSDPFQAREQLCRN